MTNKLAFYVLGVIVSCDDCADVEVDRFIVCGMLEKLIKHPSLMEIINVMGGDLIPLSILSSCYECCKGVMLQQGMNIVGKSLLMELCYHL